ncbi:MAG: electron transfer flavoprotein-ubiquinone oxidoreductase [Pseudomonadota bacterium]|nr:electron transfer flavoprotein-ubiquinone oxidoreductase [Pseudomonadota bacterium]
MNITREKMNYDLVIVGAGPSGLSAAINFKKLCKRNNKDFSVCIVEKGSEVGAHILSGAILEPTALNELFDNWKDLEDCPVNVPVKKESLKFLTEDNAYNIPNLFTPSVMHNKGNFIISLGTFCKWLSKEAEKLGVEIYPGFAASDIIIENEILKGIVTGDQGIEKDGKQGPNFQPGIEIYSKFTLFAEGCRGHLGKKLMTRFNLREKAQHQTYGIGLKELWEVKEENSNPGEVLHSIGWPLNNETYGGSFLYHLDNNLVSFGFVIGLDYTNPFLSPYEEFQRFKTHPKIKHIFEGGRRISYGARALNEGGFQSLPKLSFRGGALIGCDAGTLNTPKIKGTHTAMKSGIIASDLVFNELSLNKENTEITEFQNIFLESWAGQELKDARNVRPSFKYGLKIGMILSGIDQIILRGKAPWTLDHSKADHLSLKKKLDSKEIVYPKADGVVTFDRLTNLSFSSTYHEENQPCHLKIIDEELPIENNFEFFDSPEQRYCPAGVYEIIDKEGTPKLHINSQNCIHCKTCDIKDPKQNINWITPEGGGGPNYTNM